MKLYTSEIESYLGNITQGPSIYASDENTAKKAISNTKLFAVNEVVFFKTPLTYNLDSVVEQVQTILYQALIPTPCVAEFM